MSDEPYSSGELTLRDDGFFNDRERAELLAWNWVSGSTALDFEDLPLWLQDDLKESALAVIEEVRAHLVTFSERPQSVQPNHSP